MELINFLQMIYRYKQLDFLRLAFKYGKHYENVNFIQVKLFNFFRINTNNENFSSAFDLSIYLANHLKEYNLENFLNFILFPLKNHITLKSDINL